MAYFCAAEGCYSNSKKRGKYGYMQDINFYPFPTKLKAPRQRKIWMDMLKRENYDPARGHRVCSLHFEDGRPSQDNPYPTLFAYNNFKRPANPRNEDSVRKRARLAAVSDEIKEENMPLIEICTDKAAGIEFPIEEIVVKTSVCLHDNIKTEYVPIAKDHEYCHVDHIKENKSVEMETQTDITMEDMRKMENDSVRMENPEKLLRELFVEKVTENDERVKTYLGVPSVVTLLGIFAILEKVTPVLKYWRGNKGSSTHHESSHQDQEQQKKKTGPKRKLTKYHEFLITLLRIRLALSTQVIADIFGVSVARISQIITTWSNFMSGVFSSLLKWQDSKKVKKFMPKCFKDSFPKTTCIIDCTEFFIEKPSTPTAQAQTYSTYKHKNTFKALVAITPSGAFSFVSDLWGGNVSDRFITEQSGFLENIKRGDDVMADRGFLIRDLLLERGATLNIPPFTKKCTWGKGKHLTASDIRRTRQIAKVRIHVERAIGRLKNYKILSNTMPLKLKPLANQILKISAFLCNLQPPLVH